MIKFRKEEKSNYKSIWVDGKTIRFAINSDMPILELEYPEFYDIKLTNNCKGKCSYCYMNSQNEEHYPDIVNKVKNYFSQMTENQRPFQIAYGGGEPTGHPEFINLLKVTFDLGIIPNYTTNGMFIDQDNKNDIIENTKKYCGGVAVSTHSHLKKYWIKAAKIFIENKIKTNFHIIISSKESIDSFIDIYEEWKDMIDYFVLLPIINTGRCENKEVDWKYFIERLPLDKSKLAFGANFYPYILKEEKDLGIILYEPEIMSKFLDLKDMKIYNSSFNMI